MKKYLFILLFLLNTHMFVFGPDINSCSNENYIKNYIYSLAIMNNNEDIALEYVKWIMYYSQKYNIPPIKLANQAYLESCMNNNAIGDAYDYGVMQIRPYYHLNLLFKVDDPIVKSNIQYWSKKYNYSYNDDIQLQNIRYEKYINTNKQNDELEYNLYIRRLGFYRNTIKHFFEIRPNIEMGCILISELYNKTKNYELTLIAYNTGLNSKRFNKCKKNSKLSIKYKYVKVVICDTYLISYLAKHTDYTYITYYKDDTNDSPND